MKMSTTKSKDLNRRAFLGAAAATVASPVFAQQEPTAAELAELAASVEMERDVSQTVRHNISSFRTLEWQDYFDNLNNGAILVDITSRALHYWNEDETIYRLYPTSVPATEDLTRRGSTRVVRRVEGPDWRPTPSMQERNPEWPDYVPPGPSNPLGTHALYLSWTYYRIHGTHDTRKIGRRSSNGCIGLYNEHIAELFDLARVGTQVLLI